MTTRPYDPDKHCGAHPNAEEGPCRLPKGWGTDHKGSGNCRKHGGNTPNGRVHAQADLERQQEQAFREEAHRLGVPRNVDPAVGLLEKIAISAGAEAYYLEQVHRISAERADALVTGTLKVRQYRGEDGTMTVVTEVGPGEHLWHKLWRDERRHGAHLCSLALQRGVEERTIKLAEQQGAVVVSVIRAVLDDLQLTPQQQARVGEVVPRHLRSIGGTA